jgi:outer membrane protein assembly factor BamA
MEMKLNNIEVSWIVFLSVFIILPNAAAAEQATSVYRVSGWEINVDGNTNIDVLEKYLDLEEGREFTSGDEFDAYLNDLRQELVNLRYFDRVTVELKSESIKSVQGMEDFTAAEIAIFVKDSWTIYPLPFYNYNSNTGHSFGGIIYFYNFFGTLTDFYLNGGYNKKAWDFMVRLKKLPPGEAKWNASFKQYFKTVEKLEDESTEPFLYFDYFESAVALGRSFKLAPKVGYSASFDSNYTYNYRVRQNDYSEYVPEYDLALGLSHSLSYGKINWVENFRTGFSSSFSHTLQYSLDQQRFIQGFSGSAKWLYLPGRKKINPSAKLSFFYQMNSEKTSAASALRGITDNRLWGNRGIFLNTGLNIRLLNIRKVLELQVSPFWDSGYVIEESGKLGEGRFKSSYGLEFLLHPHPLKSFNMRLSLGYDVSDFSKNETVLIETLFY